MQLDLPYLLLIRESIDKIFEYTGLLDKEGFLNSDVIKDACLTRLIVIGECSSKIFEASKLQFPEVEWQQIKEARNFYVHVYGSVRWERVWDTIQINLPELKDEVNTIIENIGQSS